MDWQSLVLSLQLAGLTVIVLIPMALVIARPLAWRRFRGKSVAETLVALPLVLPPTVLGYYMLLALGADSALGMLYEAISGHTLVFTFEGLLLASLVFNLPFAVQPIQRAFEAVPRELREAAWCSGMSNWETFRRIELPLAWPGVLSALVLTFAHTMGEFGVVLMVGGNIAGETRTVAISIYDRVQAFDDAGAAAMSAMLLLFSFAAIGIVHALSARIAGRHDG